MAMTKLVECVPNFSEGRDQALVRDLVEIVASVPGVLVLDSTLDPDHHRSVLTFAGPPEAVGEAAFRAVRLARERIDLRSHEGGHPRIGATDVVPFVPLEGVSMAECVALARDVGTRVGDELQIPVFFYEEAATHPERRRLETIRRGGLGNLAERMAREASWRPDSGPMQPHPTAGVTVMGARPILVAFNVNLASRDPSIAKAIAHSVRTSTGGLPAVKAIGVELASRGQVQVSMNLVDIDVTSMHEALEAVRARAEETGVAVAGAEVIGLVPERAVLTSARTALHLESLSPDRILEHRLAQARAERRGLSDATLPELLAMFGSARPTPAGASLAGIVGALAAQLGAKLVRIRTRRQVVEESTDLVTELDEFSRELCRLAEADSEAYGLVLAEQRAIRSHPSRVARHDEALGRATGIPLRMAEGLVRVLTRLRQERRVPGAPTSVDIQIAEGLAVAALRALVQVVDNNMNRIINQSLKDSIRRRKGEIESYLEGLRGLC